MSQASHDPILKHLALSVIQQIHLTLAHGICDAIERALTEKGGT